MAVKMLGVYTLTKKSLEHVGETLLQAFCKNNWKNRQTKQNACVFRFSNL